MATPRGGQFHFSTINKCAQAYERMNSWQSAMTEVEPGLRGLQAEAMVVPDPDVRHLAEGVQAAASHPAVLGGPALLVEASQALHRTDLVRRDLVRPRRALGPLIAVVRIAVTSVHVQVLRALLVVATVEGWIHGRSLIVRAVPHRAPVRQIVAVMIVRAVPHRARIMQIAATAVAAMIGAMNVRAPALRVQGGLEMIGRATLHLARITQTGGIREAVTTEAVMSALVPQRLAAVMTVVVTLVRATIVHAVLPLVQVPQIVARIGHAAPRPVRATRIARIRGAVMTVAVMTVAARIVLVHRLRVRAVPARVVIAMSDHVPRHHVRDIPIDARSVGMTGRHALQIDPLPGAREILVKSGTIVAQGRPFAVVMTAIRFAIHASQMTSRRRIWIAAC